MPTYDYECDACGHTFELFQSFSDAPLTKKCPACGKSKFRRLFGGGAAIIFKGSGFYETDYRRSADDKKKAAEESKPETKDEAKPESATKTDTSAADGDGKKKSSAKAKKAEK